jgi:NAD(P)-dependent dehydrogenase (short-subunit alcohol dehydrogenase family)
MKIVVITGSSRGIGFGLAKAFLDHDCAVVISGRSEESTQIALDQILGKYDSDRVIGIPCNVRYFDQLQTLWDRAVTRFGKVDIWINNAGLSGPVKALWKQEPETSRIVIETNLLGVIYGAQVALNGMLDQNSGCIYSIEGMGSDGRMHPGMTLYGTTKYGLKYFNDALVKETRGTPIIIGSLRPGMVVTDLITEQYKDQPEEWQKVKRIFNIIADRVENVAPWLVDQILANQRTGRRIQYLSKWGLMFRFLSSPFTKRDVFSDVGL